MLFKDLSVRHKAAAIEHFVSILVGHIISGSLHVSGRNQSLQSRIDLALGKAEQDKTPWHAASFIRDDEYIMKELHLLAEAQASEAEYDLSGDNHLFISRVNRKIS